MTASDVQAVASVAGVLIAMGALSVAYFANRTAGGALKAAETQAEAMTRATEAAFEQAALSQASITELRRQHQLTDLPTVRLARPTYQVTADRSRMILDVKLRNLGPGAALNVRVSFTSMRDDRSPELNERAWTRTETSVGPGEAADQHVDGHEMRSFTPDGPTDRLVSDWWRLRLTYRSVLGAAVEQLYDWHAHHADQAEAGVWSLGVMTIDPDVAGVEPIVVRLTD